MRQLGFQQGIPDGNLLMAKEPLLNLHKIGRYGKTRDWKDFHKDYVRVWEDRASHIVGSSDDCIGFPATDVGYFPWYQLKIVAFVMDPRKRHTEGFQGAAEVYHVMANLLADIKRMSLLGMDPTQEYQPPMIRQRAPPREGVRRGGRQPKLSIVLRTRLEIRLSSMRLELRKVSASTAAFMWPFVSRTRVNITTDGYALLAFKNKISSDPLGIISRNWSFHPDSVDSSVCSWIGVICGSRRHLRVTGLDVSGMGLSGTIAPELVNLLHFNTNFLSGEIPSWIDSLNELQVLDLSNNSFMGFIPNCFTNLSKIEKLSLTNNSLQGSLPQGLGSLYNMKELECEFNHITGPIPYELFNISTSERIAMKSNSLSGTLPMSICDRLERLKWLSLEGNNLNGEKPSGLSNCSELQMLGLSMNNFIGHIPKELGNLKALEILYLDHNSNLQGFIPADIFNLSSMLVINLACNGLYGNLPSKICDEYSQMQYLVFHTNNLDGTLPKSISNCSNLILLELPYNRFSGSIPDTFGNLRLVEILSMHKNSFTLNSESSEINFLKTLSKCKRLRVLKINDNPLNGYISQVIGNLSTTLELFTANNCSLQGKIPKEFGNLSGLIRLDVTDNQMEGSIPETIKGLQNLQDSNRLNYTIPATLFNLKDLEKFNISRNFLSGVLPLEIGLLNVISLLDLSVNNLTSYIPSIIGSLQNLNQLSLAFNEFQGSIPESVGKLIDLEKLDLSHNNLAGTIPKTLENLQKLQYFNVSFNSLIGEIPANGPFKKLTCESFNFNKALCGAKRFCVPQCQKTSTLEKHKALFIVLGLAAIAGVTGFLCTYIKILRKGKVLLSGMRELG
ncbi:OLC1v1004775C1 [Oldenlandia corymbosa var. corymbosa]|uniref:OLC1v1004775C1 n=1 Tax=Oldenlandia corymbosa var. corymbosa TaxID=529605 RepID=A0AAV1DEC8_OLDCO|nr:OLC1v1004775C1 [Oldenlandia corymbosa var. corymbosa]